MSILSATPDDFGGGRTLPDRVYRATILEALVQKTDNGTRLYRQYGNLRTPEGATEFLNGDGTTFRIGNRKLFARSWIDHTNEQAAKIGQREIKREAVSAGLMQRPKKNETTELEFESWEVYAGALLGRDVLVRTKQRQRYETASGEIFRGTPTDAQLQSGEVKLGDTEAEIVAWMEG